MADLVDHAIARVAARQHGLVTRWQLLGFGLDDDAIGCRVRAGRLFRVHRGVYAVGHPPISPLARAAGAVLACGPGAALSHGSAASLWGVSRGWQRPFEVTVPGDRRPANIRVHRAALARADVRIHLGILVTSPARMLLDFGSRLDDAGLARAVNELRLARYLRLDDLAELLDRCRGHRGARRLQPFVETSGAPTRSEFEDAFRAFTERFDLPRPQLNVNVVGYEVDALFEAEQVVIELDGYEFHSSRGSFEKDRERDANLLVAGLATVRITWQRLMHAPGKEAARLDAILKRRRG